jgi:hypothetical protein
MIRTTFISNEELWTKLQSVVKESDHVHAAIAYLGTGGAKLLRFGRGDKLVVDLSAPTVQAGATNPHEIGKLMRRGVQVFTRRNLHAKLIVTNTLLIVGSANASRNSQHMLDEAALVTSEPAAIRRAHEFVARLCTEPVTEAYLRRCERAYQRPQFPKRQEGEGNRFTRVSHAKLWIVSLSEGGLPANEQKRVEGGERDARRRIKDPSHWKPWYFHWTHKTRLTTELEPGDWIIQVTRWRDGRVEASAPARFLFMRRHPRGEGKHRYVYHLEAPRSGQRLRWLRFRRFASPFSENAVPRTRPIRDTQNADVLLSLWTSSGRVCKRH